MNTMENNKMVWCGKEIKRQKNGVWKVPDSVMMEFILALIDSRELNYQKGYTGSAEWAQDLKTMLHNELERVGYFDDVEV